MVLLAGEGVAEAIDLPGTLRCVPGEFSVLEMSGNVDDIDRGRERLVGGRRGLGSHVGGRGETGFVLETVHPCVREQLEFRNHCAGRRRRGTRGATAPPIPARGLRIGDTDPEKTGRGFRNGQGGFRHTSAHHVANLLKSEAIFAALQDGGRRTATETAATGADHGQGLDRHGFREFILDPGKAGLVVPRKEGSIGVIPIRELFQREVTPAGGHLGAQRRGRFTAFRLPDGDHGDIFIEFQFCPFAPAGRRPVLERAGTGERLRESGVDGTTPLHRPPDEALHRVLGLNPRTAGGAPARSGSDGEFQAEGIGRTDGDPESFLPAFVHVDETLVHNRGRTERRIEVMHSTQADPRHPLQILSDAVLGDVSVHPVPPDTGAGGLGRVRPSLRQIGRSGRATLRPRGGLGSARHGERHQNQTNQLFHLLYINFFVSGLRL